MSEELDLENRSLCPDGACIGVIGPDGKCKICGRVGTYQGGPYRSTQSDDEAAAEAEPEDEVEAGPTDGHDDEAETPFDDDRQLCPDDTCIGIIGADGRCKVCGKVAASGGS